jgi:hypothetical protein
MWSPVIISNLILSNFDPTIDPPISDDINRFDCIKYTLAYMLDLSSPLSWKSSRATSCHYFKRFEASYLTSSLFTILSSYRVVWGAQVCGVLLLFQIWFCLDFDPLNDWSSYFWWHKSIQCIKYTLAYVLDLSSPLLGNQVEPHHATTSSALTWSLLFRQQSPFTILCIEWFEGSEYVESCFKFWILSYLTP